MCKYVSPVDSVILLHSCSPCPLFPASLDDGSDIQDVLLNMTGGRSVPRVFINKTFVGGGTDIKALQDQGKLVPMLKNAEAL